MFSVKELAFIFAILFQIHAFGQLGLTAYYPLDDCSLDDQVGGFDGFILGNLCTCGALSNGLELNGNNFGDFNIGLNSVFEEDYTISFYASFDMSVTMSMDIFSLAKTCNNDTALLIRYIPDFNLLRIRFSDSPDNRIELSATIDNPQCWNYIALSVERSTGTLYINNSLADEQSAISDFSFDPPNDVNFALGDSPCVGIPIAGDTRFTGRIDELSIYNRALTRREIQQEDFRPDQLLIGDTTIFVGEPILLPTGQICSSDFVWSPTTGLSDPNSPTPTANPPLGSTTYTLTINDGACVSTDDVTINVVSREQVQCSDLALPNTFTPNGDGINDLFGISNQFLIDELISFEIFDKWGGRVFLTTMANGLWNGERLDNQIEVGNSSYVYKVSYICEGETNVKSGVVNVLR